jgi:hypothetical protein
MSDEYQNLNIELLSKQYSRGDILDYYVANVEVSASSIQQRVPNFYMASALEFL